eukprot:10155733-Heterocapsa_arctica.AAC.1
MTVEFMEERTTTIEGEDICGSRSDIATVSRASWRDGVQHSNVERVRDRDTRDERRGRSGSGRRGGRSTNGTSERSTGGD